MSVINQTTAIIVNSLLNSPYKGYYKKEYLSVLNTLNSIYKEKQKFEDWMVEDFVNQIVGGTKDILKRYNKLGKSKECARNMLEHYIYWTYEIGNTEEAENIKKAYEEITGLKYNKNKTEDIIRVNIQPLADPKNIVITITPPKNLDKNKILKFNFNGSIEPLKEEKKVGKEYNIWILLFFIFIISCSFKEQILSGGLEMAQDHLFPVKNTLDNIWSLDIGTVVVGLRNNIWEYVVKI